MINRLVEKLCYRVSLIISLFLVNISSIAQTWSTVGSGMAGGYVYSLCSYDSVLYAGGTFIGPTKYLSQWNGTAWNAVGGGINGDVYSLATYKGSLYAGGWFSKAGGSALADTAHNIAGWNGNAWFRLWDGTGNIVYSLDTFSGHFCIPNNYFRGIGWWDGGAWGYYSYDSYPQPGFNTYSINAMAVYNAHLYAATYGPSGIVYYKYPVVGYLYKFIADSNRWDRIALLQYKPDFGIASCIAVYNNKLYVGGTFDTVNGKPISNIISWNDTIIANVGVGINGPVKAMAVYNGSLYAGGVFNSAGVVSANNIACWNDTAWSALGNGVNDAVFALTPFKGDLYVGGGFTSPGNYIAKYNSQPTNNFTSNSVLIYPNPNNGTFRITSEYITTNSHMEIYNYIGQYLGDITLNPNTTDINLVGCAGGIYFYRIRDSQNKQIAVGKILLL